ncbi:bifunctional phosphopantothenoylcysteine decarboxylase/phosphopantothenate--cysteine ligase CoaBC, partial [Candidatus Acetothermia bacterium]
MPERNLVLGVSGSIAAYKAVDLASKLTQAGVNVHTVMTENATKLVSPLSFSAITGRPATVDTFAAEKWFSIGHISLAELADAVLIAPATANVIGKIACGIADDLLTSTVIASRAPLIIAPAMHTAMWENPATQANVETLRKRGVVFVGPAVGRLASGGFGRGRFAPLGEILGVTLKVLGRGGDLSGRRIVVTAGGTREEIDPVRFIGNRSTGRMGYAIAAAARDRGAEVVLISGPTELPRPSGVEVIEAISASDMHAAVRSALPADSLIMAAAVADYTPVERAEGKIKKGDGKLILELERTDDILKSVPDVEVKVGFAAESEDLIENAKRKL